VYDVETTPNCFTFTVSGLFTDLDMTFEISPYRDDRRALYEWFLYWQATRTPMIGFNNIAFDYPVIHQFYLNPHISVDELYAYAMSLINSFNRFNSVHPNE